MSAPAGGQVTLAPAPAETQAGRVLIGLRINPRRRHLLVSPVLAKHIPVTAEEAVSAARKLAELVKARASEGSSALESAVVIGFAETAVGLGELVARELAVGSAQTTRFRPDPSGDDIVFAESHSHAPTHVLAAEALAGRPHTVVLVDDELTTGDTIRRLVGMLRARGMATRALVAVLVDARTDDQRSAIAAEEIDVMSLSTLDPAWLEESLTHAESMERELAVGEESAEESSVQIPHVRLLRHIVDHVLAAGSVHGWTALERRRLAESTEALAKQVRSELRGNPRGPVLIVGTEENLYLPLELAARVTALGLDSYVSSTTRSPAVVMDLPGYGMRDAITFAAADGSKRFLYNCRTNGDGGRFAAAVVVCDSRYSADEARRPGALVSALAGVVDEVVVVSVEGMP